VKVGPDGVMGLGLGLGLVGSGPLAGVLDWPEELLAGELQADTPPTAIITPRHSRRVNFTGEFQ